METKTYSTTKQLLINAEIPTDTRTYRAVPHQQVIDCTLEAIDKAGLVLSSETYSSSKEGNVALGKYTIKSVADTEMQLQIAWLNSYNKTKKLTYGVGASVLICQNGLISADMGFFRKKHQGGIQEFTPLAIVEYVKQAEDVFKKLQDEREKMKQVQLTKRVIAELMGRAVMEEEFITTTQLNIVKKEMEHPTHDYGAPNSMWELYNFVSFAAKELHPSLWMNSHLKMHSFFTAESGIIVPAKQVLVMSDGEEIAPNQTSMLQVDGFVSSDPTDVNADVQEIINYELQTEKLEQEDFVTPPLVVEEKLDQTYVAQLSSDPKEGCVTSPEIENKNNEDSVSTEKSIEINNESVDEETGEITIGVKNIDYTDLY